MTDFSMLLAFRRKVFEALSPTLQAAFPVCVASYSLRVNALCERFDRAYICLCVRMCECAVVQKDNDDMRLLGLHQIGRLLSTLARAARKHRLPSLCLSATDQIFQLSNISEEDLFNKLYEQVCVM